MIRCKHCGLLYGRGFSCAKCKPLFTRTTKIIDLILVAGLVGLLRWSS